MENEIKSQTMLCQAYSVVPEQFRKGMKAMPLTVAAHLMPCTGPARVFVGPAGLRRRERGSFRMIVDPHESEKTILASVVTLRDYFASLTELPTKQPQFFYVKGSTVRGCGGRLDINEDGDVYFTAHNWLKLAPRTRLISATILTVPEKWSASQVREALDAILATLKKDGLSLGYLYRVSPTARSFEKNGELHIVEI